MAKVTELHSAVHICPINISRALLSTFDDSVKISTKTVKRDAITGIVQTT